jgi:hypothetical protein
LLVNGKKKSSIKKSSSKPTGEKRRTGIVRYSGPAVAATGTLAFDVNKDRIADLNRQREKATDEQRTVLHEQLNELHRTIAAWDPTGKVLATWIQQFPGSKERPVIRLCSAEDGKLLRQIPQEKKK